MKYLVVEIGYEYNDEYYEKIEGDYYKVTGKLFPSIEEAKEVALKLSIDLIKRDSCWGAYFGEEGVLEEVSNYIQSIHGECDFDIIDLPEDVTDEQIKHILELSGLSFYKVISIED